MANNRKYLGISFPFTAKKSEGFYIDMDYNPYSEIKNDLTHLLFTPTGQRLRNPNFGTKLFRFIFEPNDEITYTDVKIEIQETMKKYFPGVNLIDFNVKHSETDLYKSVVTINYEIDEGVYKSFDSIIVNL